MTVSDEAAWRPACGECGSTSLTPAPDGYHCSVCAARWDGSEAPEPSREPSPEDPDDELERPFVCPGCHAVGGERCAPGCIDAAIEAQREARDDYDDDHFSV